MGAMKISTKGRYAIRVMLDLALNANGENVKVKQMADRQDISEKYLEQIIAVLNKADFVKSARGAQGGYTLTRKPEEYTVGDILRLTEGALNVVPCLDGNESDCERIGRCESMEIWRRLTKAIDDVVDGITLADLVAINKEEREKIAAVEQADAEAPASKEEA